MPIYDLYLKDVSKDIQQAFEMMLPTTFNGRRYYHLTSGYKSEAKHLVAACHKLGYNAIMRKAGPYLVGANKYMWVVFVGRKKK